MRTESGTLRANSEALYPHWLGFAYGFAITLALQVAFCVGFCQGARNLSHGHLWFWVSGVLVPENATLFVPVMLVFAIAGGGISYSATSRVKRNARTTTLGIAVLILLPVALYVWLATKMVCVSVSS